MAANTYGRAVDVPMTNKSGGGVIAGDVVIYDSTTNDSFTTTTSAASLLAAGIAQETIASNGIGRIRTLGYCALVNTSGSVTRLDFGSTHTVAKQAADVGASRAAGTFLRFLSSGATPDAIVYPVDLAGAALTNPMTTSQDTIVGGASGTPGRLAAGAAGAAYSMLNSVVAWNSGTSFPGSKATGDRYWRTDLGLEAYWDGTQWLTVNKYHLVLPPVGGSDVASASSSAYYRAPLWNAVYDIYLIDLYSMTFVSTTNDGTNKWTITLSKESKAAAYTQTTIVSFSTGTTPDTATQFIVHTVAINALVGTSSGTLTIGVTKVAAPGNMTSSHAVTYRVVLT